MGTTLTGTTPQDTYDSLIKVTDNGPLSGTAKYLSDGLGNDSVLALSTSNVGIGTTNANRLLVVQQNSTNTYNSADPSTFNQIQAVRNTTSGTGYNSFLAFASEPNGEWYLGSLSKSNYSDFVIVGRDAAYGERMRITSAGNVGIGTSAPTEKLDVNGNIKLSFGGALYLYYLASDNHAYIGNDGSGNMNFVTGTAGVTEKARITTDGYLRLATGGIQFNGDTAAANALDDYEEGTFAPAVIGTTTAGTANYYQQFGRYTKIGRTVNFQLFLAYDTGTGTGNLRISGLPFTATSDNVNNALAIGYFDVVSLTASHVATAWIENGTTQLGIYQYPVGGGAAAVVPYDAAANISISGTYIV